jgi:hypothetical protein
MLAVVLFGVQNHAIAQDPFHVRVHEYETLKPGEFAAELHSNYVARGTTSGDGTAVPTNNQLHLAYELTAGLAPNVSIGGMLLNGRRVGTNLEYAGWKILPHLYVPKSWRLPVDLGVVAEFSFVSAA